MINYFDYFLFSHTNLWQLQSLGSLQDPKVSVTTRHVLYTVQRIVQSQLIPEWQRKT